MRWKFIKMAIGVKKYIKSLQKTKANLTYSKLKYAESITEFGEEIV
jgi:hypothetical protein